MLVESRSSMMALFTTVLLVSLGSTSAGGKDPLSPSPVRPGKLDYRIELPQGYLKVYTATDEFDDGGVLYYAHGSYTIYTIDGKLFKSVENHISPSDESPDLVPLPAGPYLVIARSDKYGDVSIRVAIKPGQLTVLDLDIGA